MNSDDCIVLLIIVLALDMAMLVGCCIYGLFACVGEVDNFYYVKSVSIMEIL